MIIVRRYLWFVRLFSGGITHLVTAKDLDHACLPIMFSDFSKVPVREKDGAFNAVIESPRGCRLKFKFNPAYGVLVMSRPLPLGIEFPFDWGFIPNTLSEDGDPLDVLVLFDQPTYPGIVIPCRALGLIKLKQNSKRSSSRERNDRIVAVPVDAPRYENLHGPGDLAPRLRQEIEHFFLSATFFESKNCRILGWSGATEAEKMINKLSQQISKSKEYSSLDERLIP
jgi:inorganic pyrophosphatase